MQLRDDIETRFELITSPNGLRKLERGNVIGSLTSSRQYVFSRLRWDYSRSFNMVSCSRHVCTRTDDSRLSALYCAGMGSHRPQVQRTIPLCCIMP